MKGSILTLKWSNTSHRCTKKRTTFFWFSVFYIHFHSKMSTIAVQRPFPSKGTFTQSENERESNHICPCCLSINRCWNFYWPIRKRITFAQCKYTHNVTLEFSLNEFCWSSVTKKSAKKDLIGWPLVWQARQTGSTLLHASVIYQVL